MNKQTGRVWITRTSNVWWCDASSGQASADLLVSGLQGFGRSNECHENNTEMKYCIVVSVGGTKYIVHPLALAFDACDGRWKITGLVRDLVLENFWRHCGSRHQVARTPNIVEKTTDSIDPHEKQEEKTREDTAQARELFYSVSHRNLLCPSSFDS